MAKLVINPTSATKKEIPIVSRVISIGRDPSNDLVLSDSMVSRRHAILEQRENQFILRDNNSSNGTMVNGDRVETEKPLRDGDLVAIGSSRLLFQLDDTAEASIPAVLSISKNDGAGVGQPKGSSAFAEPARCPQCGKGALAGDRFCRGCGHELGRGVKLTVCRSCGTEVALPAEFCGHCGKVLGGSEKDSFLSTRPVRRLDADSKIEPPAVPVPRPRPRPAASKSLASEETAGFGIRLLAFLVDEVILGIPLLLGGLVWMSASIGDSSSMSSAGASGISPVPSLAAVGYSLLCALYYVLFWGGRGATPGKSLLGLVVRTNSGETPIGYSRAVLRLVGYVVSAVPLGLGFLFILFTEERAALHDRIAGTRVTRNS